MIAPSFDDFLKIIRRKLWLSAAMDAFALGLRKAAAIIEDGRLDSFVRDRYASYHSGVGMDIVEGRATLESLSEYALGLGSIEVPSGRQEYLETIINNILFR